MDFIRDMPLEPFSLEEQGSLICRFTKTGSLQVLPLCYKQWADMGLVYLVTEPQ